MREATLLLATPMGGIRVPKVYSLMRCCMASVALIRCNDITIRETTLYDKLSSYFGKNIYYVADNIGGRLQYPDSVADHIIEMDTALLAGLGLPIFERVGWRCGDYCYYAARETLTEAFERYWLIENDVDFSFDKIEDFFSSFEECSADFVAPAYGRRGPEWFWTGSIIPLVGAGNAKGCLFPITRLSGAAIDHLRRVRAETIGVISSGGTSAAPEPALAPNDEAFVSSILARDGFSCVNMADIAPAGALSGDSFHSAFPVMPQEVTLASRRNRVLHPVRNKAGAAWKLRVMRSKHPQVYERKRNFIVENFGEDIWRDWSSEEVEPSRPLAAEATQVQPVFLNAHSKQPPVYIHIGFHKTGTTYIQALLKKNEKALEDFLVINQRDPNSRNARAACQKLFSMSDADATSLIESIMREFSALDSEAGNRSILISDEEMFGFIPGRHGYWRLYDKAHLVMQAAIDAFPSREVRFFAYTRPSTKWLRSVYVEALKNHHLKLDLEQFLANLQFEDTLTQLSRRLQELFGPDRFTFVEMESDVASDFGLGASLLSWSGISADRMAHLQKPKRANESVPKEMQEVFLKLNRAGLPGAQLMEIKIRIISALNS